MIIFEHLFWNGIVCFDECNLAASLTIVLFTWDDFFELWMNKTWFCDIKTVY